METFQCSGPCGRKLPRKAFHEWSPKRKRPVMPQCKACRSQSYLKTKYPKPCPKCHKHKRQNRNGVCTKCNEARGLRECRGVCCALLPIAMCFYSGKVRCKDCLRAEKAQRKLRQP